MMHLVFNGQAPSYVTDIVTPSCAVVDGLAWPGGAGIPSAVGQECLHRQLGGYGGETADGESVQGTSGAPAAAAAALGVREGSKTGLPRRPDSG